jgi:hypothetical protein
MQEKEFFISFQCSWNKHQTRETDSWIGFRFNHAIHGNTPLPGPAHLMLLYNQFICLLTPNHSCLFVWLQCANSEVAPGKMGTVKDLYEFLVEAELQHYYNAFKNDLKVSYQSTDLYRSNPKLAKLVHIRAR